LTAARTIASVTPGLPTLLGQIMSGQKLLVLSAGLFFLFCIMWPWRNAESYQPHSQSGQRYFNTSNSSAPSAAVQTARSDKVEIPMATDERLERPGWWPTRPWPSRNDLVGDQVCAKCHAEKTATQRTTPMAQAARAAQAATILRANPSMTGKRGLYYYTISQTPKGSLYSVTDGTTTSSAPIAWAFGIGHKGQTYVYAKDGAYYESEMSFYSQLHGLEVTTGHQSRSPARVTDALGTLLDPQTARKCFSCHMTGAFTSEKGLLPGSAIPGVTCEACHGPGQAHAVMMQQLPAESAPGTDLKILNPRSLSPVASVDFCGACHRTWTDVYEQVVRGVVNARFQPYRLENSKCWAEGDARLTCIACHDPHQELVHDAAAYDQKCLACHQPGKAGTARNVHQGKSCPVEKRDCVTCHMPKVNVPVMHSAFTDHWIRIVRKGQPYPD
jgi:hypothetical protein